MPRNDSSHDEAAGKATGRRWVTEQSAPADELARLDDFHRSLEGTIDWGRWFSNEPNDAFSVAERLYFVLSPDNNGDRDEAQTFWEAVLFPEAADYLTPEFVEGFVVGALEAWNETRVAA